LKKFWAFGNAIWKKPPAFRRYRYADTERRLGGFAFAEGELRRAIA
jgi:hypothetical protein